VVLDVLEARFEVTGCPGVPGADATLPPLPGTRTTVSVYGATVTEEVEVCEADVIVDALLANV
jgi:hypothetical protein